jgi:hypothetical protein
MQAKGVRIVELPRPCARGTKGDLGRVQARLRGEAGKPLSGDGSITLLAAETEFTAADLVADWLAGGDEGDAGLVAVLDGSTVLLNEALASRGLPRFGHRPPSALRGALQVLPLAFATRWAPFDPFRLLDLLMLPDTPIPRAVGRILARALTEAPGRGGRVWNEAIAEAKQARRERIAARDGLDGKALAHKAEADAARWLPWLGADLVDPAIGIAQAEASAICARVAAWAAPRSVDEPAMAALAAASRVGEAIAASGLASLPRLLLERLLADATGDGADHPDAVAEAAPWSHVIHPGRSRAPPP